MSELSPQDRLRATLVEDIIDLELGMFMSITQSDGLSELQQHPASFRVMRWMNHAVHSDGTLLSYYNDLENALANGRNLILEKYARLDDQIPPLSANPLIATITAIESDWRNEAAAKYPERFANLSPQGFERYLNAELETLSDNTLEHYYADVEAALQDRRNLVLDRQSMLEERLKRQSSQAQE